MNNNSFITATTEQGFRERWRDFQGDAKTFPLWTSELAEEEIKARFDQMQLERLSVYFTNPEDCKKRGSVGIYKKLYQTLQMRFEQDQLHLKIGDLWSFVATKQSIEE